ncbi:MAG: polysaccharide pyruvyl transferase family protein [Lachnospiraceae bacterium]|nr:polysaccharide pyruvyl transferase family protein [Lachnospiraceae bacterium]
MKIGLITIVNGASFGNRLQNYATQTLLQNLGFEVETLNDQFEKNSKLKIFMQHILGLGMRCCPELKRKAQNWERGYTFHKWDSEYIRYSSVIINAANPDTYRNLADLYDCFLVGSDQIWNPRFSANKGYELLSFAPKNKRVSLSTSIGIEDIPDEYRQLYATEWKKFKSISVREHSAAQLVKEITGVEAAVHIDPTLMLTRSQWNEFAKRPKGFDNKNYFLTFFLTEPSERVKQDIHELAAKKKVQVINLDRTLKGYEFISPNEFVSLIANTRMVFTDSFHCTVFSLIFGKSLAVFDRFDLDRVSSRLLTLLETVQKPCFWLGKDYRYEDIESNYCITGYSIEHILKEKRDEVMDYIYNNLIPYEK